MRALEVKEPWGVDQLTVVERDAPTAGPGQVLVRMKAISLNYRDLLMVGGVYGRGPSQSGAVTPFSDACGVVEAVGPGVTRVAVGDRVSTLFFQNWVSGPPDLAKLSRDRGQDRLHRGVARGNTHQNTEQDDEGSAASLLRRRGQTAGKTAQGIKGAAHGAHHRRVIGRRKRSRLINMGPSAAAPPQLSIP